jgi:2-polyprenyl-6-methoxyphenol hydroxylase-like FAD-dependent oxidoreductase
MHDRVLIVGAGPVGLVAAANLLRHGIPVTVLEAGADLSTESRASTFHPPTLDMLAELSVLQPLLDQGLIAPKFQYRSRVGVMATFDFGFIADATRHAYRVQCEQSKLTRIVLDKLGSDVNFEIEFSSPVRGVAIGSGGAEITIDRHGKTEKRSYPWVIGADGARSNVRNSLGIPFEGFTWPERYLVVSTSFDFTKVIPDLVSVSYVADPQRWYFLLQIPGLWRVMFRIAAEESDELALSHAFTQRLMSGISPEIDSVEVTHATLYRVHQRVAETYRKDCVFIVGDAAHVNNPLGGMGMNGGIHDALNLTERLADVCYGGKPERRSITKEHVEKQSIQNKKNLENPNEFGARLPDIVSDPQRTYDYLIGVSMIGSLRRAEQLG